MSNASQRLRNGFSLIDVMVGMVVGLLTMLAIMQSFSAFEGQKRTTTYGMEAQENGLIALHALETDIRQAGYGMVTSGSLACTQINTYNNGVTTLNAAFIPIQITDGGSNTAAPFSVMTPGAKTDTITASYSTSATGGIPANLAAAMPNSSAVLTATTGNGVNVGDILLLATPGSTLPCSRLAVTGTHPQANGVDLIHNSGTSVYNPPGGSNIFPASGYGTSPQSVVFNMGTMVQNQYQVLFPCSTLVATNLFTTTAAPACTNTSSITNATPISGNIVNIQAQYGIAAPPAGTQQVYCWVDATTTGGAGCSTPDGSDWTTTGLPAGLAVTSANVARIKAIRVAVVARSSLMERPNSSGVCNATLSPTAPNSNYPQWHGGVGGVLVPIDVTTDATGTAIPSWQCYRYKVYETVIPLRNILWANL